MCRQCLSCSHVNMFFNTSPMSPLKAQSLRLLFMNLLIRSRVLLTQKSMSLSPLNPETSA